MNSRSRRERGLGTGKKATVLGLRHYTGAKPNQDCVFLMVFSFLMVTAIRCYWSFTSQLLATWGSWALDIWLVWIRIKFVSDFKDLLYFLLCSLHVKIICWLYWIKLKYCKVILPAFYYLNMTTGTLEVMYEAGIVFISAPYWDFRLV